ncbi:F-box protein At3g07870-like [Papaver somniferum]|uniref:F-box protein At3g07870-like n=1 Tax=Papaver somniferum TaxID=3469 RepID=UPI000E6F4A23|nr:F-box protein At3g07870-like [Papaver somniferum]
MENLNDDMRLEIFSRLPPLQLLKCKLVCKNWENLLSLQKVGLLFLIEPSLRDRNLQLHFGDYEEIFSMSRSSGEEFTYQNLTKINHPAINKRSCVLVDMMIGSCNGLVCFCIPHNKIDDPVYICNPITTEYINLPRLLNHKNGYVVSGFGYHPLIDKYKVIRIHYPRSHDSQGVPITLGSVEVYTLGSGTGWRSIGEVTYDFSRSGVLANGSLYWLDYKQKRIVAFDLADEEFRLLPTLPPCFNGNKKATYHVKVLGGDLCLVHSEPYEPIDIWSFKNKEIKTDVHGDKEERYQSWSWSLEFRIPCSLLHTKHYLYEPFALTKKHQVLLWIHDSAIYCYDKKTESLNEVVGEDQNRMGLFQGIPHMNSLISMKALGEKFKSRTHQKKEKKNRERIR